MNRGKVLITDEVHPLLLDGLRDRNWDLEYQPEISLGDARNIIGEFEGLVMNSKIRVDKSFLDNAAKLLWIARLGSGMEIIDVSHANQKGIYLISTPEANCNAVAEHALGMILALFRNLTRADFQVKNHIWQREQNRGEELSGKTIGIIGYGHTGQRFEELLSGLNVKILVYDKYKQLSNQQGRYVVVNDVNEIKNSAEVISLHLPLTSETKNLVDKDFIGNCKNQFYLINTSRGKIVGTADLIEGLKTGKVKGACLDVFENENPLAFTESENLMYNELYRMENVILSPHIAGWTFQSKERIAKTILRKLDIFLEKS